MIRKPQIQTNTQVQWDLAILGGVSDKTHNGVARGLASRAAQIRKWGRQFWAETALSGRAQRGGTVNDELARVRSEIARLRQEREMLLTAVFSLLPEQKKNDSLTDAGKE